MCPKRILSRRDHVTDSVEAQHVCCVSMHAHMSAVCLQVARVRPASQTEEVAAVDKQQIQGAIAEFGGESISVPTVEKMQLPTSLANHSGVYGLNWMRDVDDRARRIAVVKSAPNINPDPRALAPRVSPLTRLFARKTDADKQKKAKKHISAERRVQQHLKQLYGQDRYAKLRDVVKNRAEERSLGALPRLMHAAACQELLLLL